MEHRGVITTNTKLAGLYNDVTMSYFTQMAGLAYHNFFSAAVGIAVAIALVRGISPAKRRLSAISGSIPHAPVCTCCCPLYCLCRSLLSARE